MRRSGRWRSLPSAQPPEELAGSEIRSFAACGTTATPRPPPPSICDHPLRQRAPIYSCSTVIEPIPSPPRLTATYKGIRRMMVLSPIHNDLVSRAHSLTQYALPTRCLPSSTTFLLPRDRTAALHSGAFLRRLLAALVSVASDSRLTASTQAARRRPSRSSC